MRRPPIVRYLAIPVALYLFVLVVPTIEAVRQSLYESAFVGAGAFAGLGNYRRLLRDSVFWASFRNNVFIVVAAVVGQIGLGFLLTLLIVAKGTRLREVHRTILFFPVVLAPVVVGFLWQIIYDRYAGLLNALLESAGLDQYVQAWLSNPETVMMWVTIPIIWKWVGLYLVIFMAAYHAIPKEIFEITDLAGATPWQRTRHVTVPLLRNTTRVALVLCISGNMKIFDEIFVMTAGGPARASMVMALYAYNTSFNAFEIGYGAAISVGMLVLTLSVILLSRRLLPAQE
ncbi:MAG: sugar ABC transporter permease [Spirochaetales bacterium]|nr:sugar ABC transporter permease [Spirochaetales bacterium]